jgi:flagellin
MITINTNTASSMAAYNLGSTNVNLQKSLQRLSSGSRINSSLDDAGGLAVSMKLSASIRRTEATQANVNNSISFLQTQDGVLKNAEKVVVRMAELVSLATDVTKSTNDKALYQTEYQSLQSQLSSIIGEEFNGISLFTTGGYNGTLDTSGNTLTVVTAHDGEQTIGISQADLGAVANFVGTASAANLDASAGGANRSLGGVGGVFVEVTSAMAAISTVDTAIQRLATLRANNGAEQSRLTFAADMLSINKVNLESANSRIADVDIASESANLARFNILQQAGTAMLAQANMSQQSVLRLLS